MKPLWKNAAFNIAYKFTGLLFPLIRSIYVSRILLTDGVGKIATGQNLVSYFVVFAALGIPSYGMREIAKAREDSNQRNRTFSELFTINAVSTCFAIAGYLLLVFSVPDYRNELPLFLACGVQLLFNFISIDWLYEGEEEYIYIATRSIVIKLLATLALFLFVKTKEDYVVCALITSLGLGANYLFNIFNARKHVAFTFRGLRLKRHLPSLMVLLATYFFTTIYSKVDITMLGLMTTDSDVGLYSNANRLADMLACTCSAVTGILLPRLSYYYENDRDQFLALVATGTKVLAFLAIPLATGVFILAPQGVHLVFGPAFISSGSTLRIFAFLIPIRILGDLLCYRMALCTGNEKRRLPVYVAAVVVNIILNFLFIPRWRSDGAALASVLSSLVINVPLLLTMKRLVGFPIEWQAIGQALVSSAVMALSVLAVLYCVENYAAQIVLSLIVGVSVYLVFNLKIGNEVARKMLHAGRRILAGRT